MGEFYNILTSGKKRTARKDELLFNLQQHVKYNVLKIDKDFYLQNVGIPQGSILSSLLCSFYYGHMENSKIVPFVNKVTEMGMSVCWRDQVEGILVRIC